MRNKLMQVWKRLRSQRFLGSISLSIILSFTLLISVVVVLLSALSYRHNMKDIESTSIRYTMSLLSEVNSSIDSYIDNMKSMGEVIVENKDVREMMAFYSLHRDKILSYYEEKERDEVQSRAANLMNLVANTRSDITNIAVISVYGDIVLSNPDKSVNPHSEYEKADWYSVPLTRKDEIVVSPSHVQNLVDEDYRWVISISKAVTDPQTGEVTGVMVIDLNYRSIEAICENAQLGKNGYIYLIDSLENLIFHPQQHLIYSGIKTEEIESILALPREQPIMRPTSHRIYLKDDSPVTGWSAVGVVNTSELARDRAATVRYYTMLALISILFAAAVAVFLSTTITRPIKQLEQTMHRVEEGDLGVRSAVHANNEIGHLSQTFDDMVIRLRQLMENAVANEEQKRQSEIKALQAQINPHFLYNTLDTIVWMSASGKNEQVMEVTSALARLFRTSISSGDSLVPLRMEVDNIKSYLTIQKMRYKDKLSYRIEIPPELFDLMIPKLILQPIVENAVYHGIKESPNGGEVRILGGCEPDGSLALTVEDDGVGMSAAQLEKIFRTEDKNDRGIGVINVHERIRLHFGEGYGLQYCSREGGGTTAVIRLPAVRGEGQAGE